MANKKFKCTVCGYIHEGDKAPDVCPVCQAPASKFVEMKEKKGLDKNSSVYIFVYMAVIIVIVALLLAIVYSALKPRQDKNVELDTKKQILSSLPAVSLDDVDVEEVYTAHIKQYVMLNAEGEVTKTVDDFNYEPAEGELPMYIADVDGATKYIIPMDGKGLWGPIWGYIALNDDKNTVYGVYYSHEGETPGLGAKITTEEFQVQFQGKHIMNGGEFASIAIMKAGKTAVGQEQVDAISGATITSKGVESMIFDCLSEYTAFFTSTNALTEGGSNNE